MATHHDDDSTMPEETQGYKLSQPKQSIAEYQQMGMSIYARLLLTTFSLFQNRRTRSWKRPPTKEQTTVLSQ